MPDSFDLIATENPLICAEISVRYYLFCYTCPHERFSDTIMLVGYGRVSTNDQDPQMQIAALRLPVARRYFLKRQAARNVIALN